MRRAHAAVSHKRAWNGKNAWAGRGGRGEGMLWMLGGGGVGGVLSILFVSFVLVLRAMQPRAVSLGNRPNIFLWTFDFFFLM